MPHSESWGRAAHWPGRLLAVVTGVGLFIGGINFAADLGDIVVGLPMVVLGGLQLLYAITNHYPRWSAFPLVTAIGLLLGGLNFLGDFGASLFAVPLLILGGLQLIYSIVARPAPHQPHES